LKYARKREKSDRILAVVKLFISANIKSTLKKWDVYLDKIPVLQIDALFVMKTFLQENLGGSNI